MAEDNNGNQDLGTGAQAETVTLEQFNELTAQLEESKKMFEDIKKAQSGSDKTVTELRKQLEQKEKDSINEKKTLEQRTADEVAEMKKAFASERAEKIRAINESMARQMLVDADLRVPRTLSRLVGKDEEETRDNIQAYIEDRQDDNASNKDKEAKRYGRKITDTTGKSMEAMSYEDMAALSQEKFNAIPRDVVNKAMNAALNRSK